MFLSQTVQWASKRRFTISFWLTIAGIVFSSALFQACDYGCGCSDNCNSSPRPYSAAESRNFAPVSFELNLGQGDSHYGFVAQGAHHSIQLAAREAVFDFPASRGVRARRIRAIMDGASEVQGRGEEPRAGRVNYFLGNDPHRWVTGVPTFGRVIFHEIYPGIDISYHGAGGYIENDFILVPGADPQKIRIRFEGADTVKLESDGSLTVNADGQRLSWQKPLLYQTTATGRKKAVEGRFRLDSRGSLGFEVGAYDPGQSLVIDPVMTYATYFGTPNTDGAARVATDASGNAYFVGASNSAVFPVAPSSSYYFSPVGGLRGDVIVGKLSADGKQMIYTTHIGGGQSNTGLGIAVDPSGNVYVTGVSSSPDFPHTTDLSAKNIIVNANCFVTKLNSSASAIIYSTLIGGSDHDGCGGIAVDASGNAYVVGATSSTDFPTANPVQASLRKSATGYSSDAFVAKLSPDGTRLLFSTYLGGGNPDMATAVALDAAGNAYLTGFTLSSDFPISSTGVFQSTYGGAGGQLDSTYASGDAFVVKMTSTGSIVYSTFIGGSQDDIGASIAVDAQGNAYICGATLSKNFPTRQAFQTTYGGSGGETNLVFGIPINAGDGFVAELNSTGTDLVFSSYLGGSRDDRATAIALDSSGNIWLTGHTLSRDFPLSQDAPQKTNAGDDGGQQSAALLGDAFVTQIGASHSIVFSTYLGGGSADWGSGIAVDGTGGVIVAGGTASTNFPTTQGAVQTKFAGTDLQMPVGDAIIARFGGSVVPTPSIAGISNAASYAGGAIAPGEAVLIAGSLIGPSTLAGAALDANGRVSSLVAGVRFLFDETPAPIVYTSAGYSSVIVPYSVAGKSSTQLVAVLNGVRSAPVAVPVVPSLPGIFSADASGHGQGAILNSDGTFNSPQNPAPRGSVIAFFATGEGQTNPAGIDGAVTLSTIRPQGTVSVTIGGVPAADLKFVGEAPSVVAGVLQVNVTVPDLTPIGNVPLLVTVGNASSQQALTIAVK